MDAKPGEREPPVATPQDEPSLSLEHIGPVELRRMRKDDDRALLLFRHIGVSR
jgi:hypothetical protein